MKNMKKYTWISFLYIKKQQFVFNSIQKSFIITSMYSLDALTKINFLKISFLLSYLISLLKMTWISNPQTCMLRGWDTYAWMLFNISTLFSCISTEHLTSSFSVTLANKTSLFFLISFTFPPYQAHIRELLCSMPIPSFGMTQFGVNSTDQHCLSALLFS